jgi:sensor histidine kinase YesM
MGNQRFIQTTTELLHKVYQANGNYPKAYEMLLISNRIRDSSKVEISRSALVEQELKHDYEKKAWKHQLETQRKNNLLIGLSVAMLLFFLAGYFLYRNSKQKQRIATFEKNSLKQKLLLSQMNPHFVYNSIDNIKSLIYNKKDNQAVNYLTKFSKLMRQILEHSNENYIALDEEIAVLENYLSIQQLLYNNKFEFAIDVAPGTDTQAIYIPPMLTQPFIENAIKHGLRNKPTGGQIRIRFYLNEKQLYFEVIDNGEGFKPSQSEGNHKSLGVAVTRERLENYTKNKKISLQIENVLNQQQQVVGAKIVFEIPYIYEN